MMFILCRHDHVRHILPIFISQDNWLLLVFYYHSADPKKNQKNPNKNDPTSSMLMTRS